MINKVLWAVIALPALVSLLSCGSDESQSQLLPMEKPIFKLGYPKDDAQRALLAVTDSQLRVLTRLIDVTGDDDPDKSDLLQRRADLYAEQANYFRQKDDATKASRWSDLAIAEFNRVIAYPASAKSRDQAMLGLGLVQYAIDRNDEAKQTLTRFMTEYPASELIGLAHFWYGEIMLREGDISTAEASLQNAAQNRAAPSVRGWYVSPQTWDLIAQYLLGWCSMLRKQYREGLERFQAAAAAKPTGELRSEVARSVGPLVCYRRARQSVSCWISTVGIHLRCMMWLEAIFCGEIPKRASIWLLPLQDRAAQHLQIPVSASDIPAKRSSKLMALGGTGCGFDAFNLQISRTAAQGQTQTPFSALVCLLPPGADMVRERSVTCSSRSILLGPGGWKAPICWRSCADGETSGRR
jgi:tetratricopeptide (TPR) repeat protein